MPPAAALSLCLLLAPAAADNGAAAWGLDALMSSLQQVKSSSASFVEDQRIGLLKHRLHSSGALRYVAPDWLVKTTERPVPESVELRGGLISGVQRNGSRYQLRLEEHPEVAALVEGIRATLAGDLAALQRYYMIDLRGQSSDWQLKLTPVDPQVRDKVDAIFIRGTGSSLRAVEVHETDGDRSDMRITPLP